jgi:hypothetical protein
MIRPASTGPAFTATEAVALLGCARRHVEAATRGRDSVCELPADLAATPVAGVFVTLLDGDRLRACIGNWHAGQPEPLGTALTHAARAAATCDHRFAPLLPAELPLLTVEVTVLHHPRAVEAAGEARLAEVVVGRHGLLLEDPHHRGLLLPQVARDHGWDARTLLEHTAVKAGLPAGAWRNPDVRLVTFEAVQLIEAK